MLNQRITHLEKMLHSRSGIFGNQGVVVIGALLLAITLWFLVTLNQEYETLIYYPVTVENVPNTVQMGVITPSRVKLQVRGSGVDLLEEHLHIRRDTLRFPYTQQFRDGFFLTNPALREVSEYLPAGLVPLRISPDSIFFAIDDRVPKKVPLVHRVDIRLKLAYQLEAHPVLRPDSVIVQGPKAMLDTLKAWYTKRFQTAELSKKTTIEVEIIDTISGFSVFPKRATLALEPRLYTQLELILPVNVVDLPPGVSVRLAQPNVKVSCLVPMDEYENLRATQYQILIRYPDIDREVPYLIPNTDFLKLPIRVVGHSPTYISYVIVTRKTDAS